MASNDSPAGARVDLRKYPNRRYYDTARSRHVTLEAIHGMIRDGAEVRVVDSKTGEDITAKVLAQIILDLDPPKLGMFPVEMLHQIIRANEPLVRDFIEKYFNQAWKAFFDSQRHFDSYLRHAFGLPSAAPFGGEWMRMIMGPLVATQFAHGSAGEAGEMAPRRDSAADSPQANGGASEGELRTMVEQLRQQVVSLEAELLRSRGNTARG